MRSETIQAWYERWQAAIYAVVLLVALPAPYFFLRLRSDNAIETWLGDGDAELARFRAFCREFGTSEFVLLALDDCEADDPRLEPLAEQIDRTRVVLQCWTPQRVFEVQAALSGSEDTVQASSFAPLTGRHPAFTAIFIPLKSQPIADRAWLLQHLESLAIKAGFRRGQLHWGGAPVVNVALDRWATRSLLMMLPVSGALVFGLLWWLLGRLSLALMVLFCSGWSTFVTVGLMAACGTTMNMFLVALPPMLLVLNLSFGIHLIHQWMAAPDARCAVGHAVARTFMPTLFSALTSAIGAGSLATSRFAPVRAFGVWSAVGTMIAMFVTYIYIPSLLVGERRRDRPSTAGGLPLWLHPRAWRAKLLWGAVACAMACIGLWRLRGEADALTFLPSHSATLADYRLIERRLCGLLPVEVVVETPPELDWQARLKIVREATAALRRHPLVENVSGLAEAFGPDLEAAATIVEELAASDGWRRQSASMVSADGRRWRITAAVDSGHSEDLETIVAEIGELLGGQARVEITGLVPLLITAQREIFRSLLMSFLGAVFTLVPVLGVHFRSLPAALVALVPNVAPVATLFGLLGWLDRPINVATLTTASIALGLALDNTLHLVAHFRAYRLQYPAASRHDAVEHALRICHRAMIDATLVAGLGLGVLLLSPFKPTAEFGLLLASLVTCTLLNDLLITPALLCSPLGEWFASGVRTPSQTLMQEEPKSTPGIGIAPRRRIQASYEAVSPL
ncbi:MAG TPA: MMPL family transporter [Pirellulales bacterium]|nr:MMPL family transporter [Pirellulales bacterium]